MKDAGDITSLSIWVDGSIVEESAGIGYQIRAHGEKVSWGYDSRPECNSSTKAEVLAVVFALREARKFPNANSLHLYSDSESVVHMIDPSKDVEPNTSELVQPVQQARQLLTGFDFFSITHKPREFNEDRAHDLANRGHRLSASDEPKLRRNVRLLE